MLEILQTDEYARWFLRLKDCDAKARIDIRLRRLSLGNYGDIKSVGDGVFELRLDYGPGYRVYLLQQGEHIVILLAGGEKGTQK